MKIWAIGDVHGYIFQLNKLLKIIEAKMGPEDKVIILGDYIDRGPSSLAVLHRVTELKVKYKERCILLWGNHEDMFAAAMGLYSPCNLDSLKAYTTWWGNGGKEAVEDVKLDDLVEAFKTLEPNLQLYHKEQYVNGRSIIFVHGSYPVGAEFTDEAFKERPFHILWGSPFYDTKRDSSRLMVCGHIPKKEGYESFPDFICVDAGSFFTQNLTAVELDTNNPSHREFITVGRFG